MGMGPNCPAGMADKALVTLFLQNILNHGQFNHLLFDSSIDLDYPTHSLVVFALQIRKLIKLYDAVLDSRFYSLTNTDKNRGRG